jgi:hypothetical protein
MNLRTFLALTMGIIMVTRVEAAPTQSPLQVRLNTELVAGVFHKRDQEILNVLNNMTLGEDSKLFSNVSASIMPAEDIKFADFDFDLHMETQYMGAEST